MAKNCHAEKRPQGRPPAGAVLVDGKWHTTQQSTQIAIERLLQQRERRRAKRIETRELMIREHPELFVVARGAAEPKQTTIEARSDTPSCTLERYQKRD